MMLAAGLKPGLVVMALDVSKAFVVTFPLRLLLPPLCAALAGLLCVLGHILPVFLHFRGGKGTACLCGTVLGLTPELVLRLLALIFVIGMIWNRASIQMCIRDRAMASRMTGLMQWMRSPMVTNFLDSTLRCL